MRNVRELESAAEKGDVKAQLACARIYMDFAYEKRQYHGVPGNLPDLHAVFDRRAADALKEEAEQDLKAAFQWYVKAAAQNDPDAVYELGERYLAGEGTYMDFQKAQELLLRAAELGKAEAQYRVGMQFLEGSDGVERDYKKAVFWLEKASAQGDHFAEYALGRCYERGLGVGRSFEEAVRLYREITECEHPFAEAFFELAHCYEDGLGVKQDFCRALQLYREAAEAGDTRAAIRLGEYYEHGRGVEKDRKRAIEWYNFAAAQGDEDGIAALCRLSL